ncbi:hypothetical protein [Enterobacter soli]|uniref:hypothetical protein n=1 Tax=Enterobacter soli TaxID=885040 RepID=UPI002F422C73
MVSCTNIQHRSASFKENGDLNSYGLRRAIDLIGNECLPRSARVILSLVCQVAAATSAYKITKSRRRMAEECGTTEATIRRNLKKAVDAGILSSTLVFDKSEKGLGQMPTEYQFTTAFLDAAKTLCKAMDKARNGLALARSVFMKSLSKLRQVFCSQITPRSDLPSPPDHSDHQELVSFDDKNSKENSAQAERISVFQKAKTWATARHERATTKANDYAERQDLELAKRQEERAKLDGMVKRHAYVTGATQRQNTRAIPAQRNSTQSTFNAQRYEDANRQHDQVLKRAAEAAARSTVTSPIALLQEVKRRAELARKGKK